MGKEYTKKEVEQLRLLAEAEEQECTEPSFSEEEIAQMILASMGVDSSEQRTEDDEEEIDDLQSILEQSYISRNLTGRGLVKIHGLSTPKRIYW